MRRPAFAVSLAAFLLSIAGSQTAWAQKPTATQASRDPQAATVLAQSLAAAGGLSNLGALQDFRATGTITYYWADSPVNGSVTIRGKGLSELRLDANVPNGTKSWRVSDGAGSSTEVDGSTSPIENQNGKNLSYLAFPYLKILSALNDPAESISLVSPTGAADSKAIVVRIQKDYTKKSDPDGSRTRLSQIDFAVDPTSGLVLEQRDDVFAPFNMLHGVPHVILYGDYRSENGVAFPHSVTELVGGQKTWTLQVQSVSFNTGLTDSDFQF